MLQRIKEEGHRHGDRISLLAASWLPELKKSFDKLEIDTSRFFNFSPAQETDWTFKSIVVAAAPSRRCSVSFTVGDREYRAHIPPAFSGRKKKNEEIELYLKELLEKEGYHIRQVKQLPCKALAACTGLGRYGRNNIIYVEGFGSFLSLHVFLTDVSAENEPFVPFGGLDSCKDCEEHCIKNCPAGALSSKQRCVEIERCLCDANENEGEFPEWLDPSWHNALIGCERCQLRCPQNKELLEPVEEIARFNREETEAFLSDKLPSEIFERTGISSNYWHGLARNLKGLLAANNIHT